MTTIVGHELLRYNIDIAAVGETRFADTEDLTEVGSWHKYRNGGKR
jgi:hypothetical protein